MENNIKDWIKEQNEKTFKEMPEINNKKWVKFSTYLFEQMMNNKAQEFRLVLDDGCEKFYIHPLNKNGDTLDLNVFDKDD